MVKNFIVILLACFLVLVFIMILWSKPVASPIPPHEDTVNVYFLNNDNFAIGREPYETAVKRKAAPGTDRLRLVLAELMKGPTAEEKESGLDVIKSEATDLDLEFDLKAGIASVYLKGGCNAAGATYTIGNLIIKNLRQFPEVKAVKIYDPEGETLNEGGPDDTLPACLQP